MAAVAPQQHERIRWAELEEEDGGDIRLPTVDIWPKENYRRKPIENRVQGGGKKDKVSLNALIFGIESSSISCSRSKVGDSTEDEYVKPRRIKVKGFLRLRPRTPGSKAEEPPAFGDPSAMASKGQAIIRMECRICGVDGDHWSFKCPDLALPTETFVDRSFTEHPICQVCKQPADVGKDDASVRLTNLPKDTSESDLIDLVRRFGPLIRVHLAMDQESDSARKFAIVEYGQWKDAEKAISLLNGYDYDSAILRVERATPRPETAYSSVCSSCMEASETCIRVTNISEDVTGHFFLDLFRRCGLLSVAYLSADKMSRSNTQVGIVEYYRKASAEMAIERLNGFDIYDLALRVQGPFRLQDLQRDLGV